MSATGSGGMVDVLLRLEAENQTGPLEFRAEGVVTRVFVEGGVPVSAEAGALGETLGHVLRRERLITDAQFAAVVRKMTDAIVNGEKENARFGEVIVDLGILTRQDVTNALAAQVEKKVIGCVARGEGDWTFEPTPAKGGVERATPIRALLADAAKLLADDRVDALLGAGEAFPVRTMSLAEIGEHYGLDEEELAVAGKLDGTRSLADVVGSSRDAREVVCALVLGKSVELLAARASKPPPPETAPLVGAGRRRTVLVKLAPDTPTDPPPARVPSLRPAENEREAGLFAEDEFQSGKRLLGEGLLEESHAQLVLASERSPHIPLYGLYEQFVRSRIEKRFADPDATRALALKMLREDGSTAFAHYVLGYVALEASKNDAAMDHFDRAFRLDRDLLDAGRQARRLGGGRPTLRPQPAPRAARDSAPRGAPNARVYLLLAVLALVTLGTVGYVLAARAGAFSDYEVVR